MMSHATDIKRNRKKKGKTMTEYIMKSSPILESDGTPLEIVGELIRCKECKHWECADEESYCNELGIFNTDHNSYCSYAKRKDNGNR